MYSFFIESISVNRDTVDGVANLLQEFIHALTPSYKKTYYLSIKRAIALLIITWLISLSPLLSTFSQAQGDANQDGLVTSADITCTILGIFGMSCPMPDCNEDGSVTSADITCVILGIFGQSPAPTPTPTPTPTSVVVEFVYEAATEVDPGVAQQFPQCVQGVGQTHIHPSWRNFVRIDMNADNADRWSITFTDVPVDSEQRIRISDPNACASDPNGASAENVFANGTQLLRVVDTPGNGIEPGLAFIVSPSGEVFP